MPAFMESYMFVPLNEFPKILPWLSRKSISGIAAIGPAALSLLADHAKKKTGV